MKSARTVGVVSDTHVPDRARSLHPELLDGLRAAQVEFIIHAGDICVPSVLRQIEQVAPVVAVRGNRDLIFRRGLPMMRHLEFAGVPLALVHGHGSLVNYLLDKWKFYTQGYNLQRYQNAISRTISEAKVIVFGHTHRPENVWREGQLWFNPGSASISDLIQGTPSFGVLHFDEGGEVRGEIIKLMGARLENRKWVIINKKA